MEARLDRPQRRAEGLGDCLVRHALDVVEDQDRAELLRDRQQGSLDVDRRRRGLGGVRTLARRHVVLLLHGHLADAPPERVVADVDGDPV
jgi:hypothetical protein